MLLRLFACLCFLGIPNVYGNVAINTEFAKRFEALEERLTVEVSELRSRLQTQEEKLNNQVKLNNAQGQIIQQQQERMDEMEKTIAELYLKLEHGNVDVPEINTEVIESSHLEFYPAAKTTEDRQYDATGTERGAPLDEPRSGDNLTSGRNIAFESYMKQQRTLERDARQFIHDTRVAFSAGIGQRSDVLGEHQIIPFEKIFVLVDSTHSPSTYSKTTGVFTAPVSGVYVFSVTILGDHGFYGHFYIYKNNDYQSILFVDGVTGGSRYDKMSQTLILILDRGDSVSIRNGENGHTIYGNNHSLFCGFLLYEYETVAGLIG